MSWVCNQWDSWIFHGKYVLHSSSLHKVRLQGTFFKGKLLTGEASFPRQIESSLNNHWEQMKAIQIMQLKIPQTTKPRLHRWILVTGIQDSSSLKSRESSVVTDFSCISTKHGPCVKWERSLILADLNQNYAMLAAMQSFPNWLLELPVFYHMKEQLLHRNFRTQLLKIFLNILINMQLALTLNCSSSFSRRGLSFSKLLLRYTWPWNLINALMKSDTLHRVFTSSRLHLE